MKTAKAKFREGQRVKLLPFEDQPEERGQVEVVETHTSEGMTDFYYIVRLEKKFITEAYDDGIREVMEEQLEAL